jgi:hypothetical protein
MLSEIYFTESSCGTKCKCKIISDEVCEIIMFRAAFTAVGALGQSECGRPYQ